MPETGLRGETMINLGRSRLKFWRAIFRFECPHYVVLNTWFEPPEKCFDSLCNKYFVRPAGLVGFRAWQNPHDDTEVVE